MAQLSQQDLNIRFKKACIEGNLETMKSLFKKVDQKTKEESLGIAADQYNQMTVEYLLNEGVNPNANENSVLFRMSERAYFEMVDLYVSMGGNIHAVDKNKDNALHHAADAKYSEITKFLVALGVDYKARNNQGETPLQVSSTSWQQEFLKKVQKNPSIYWNIMSISSVKQLRQVRNAKTIEKMRPLVRAADPKTKEVILGWAAYHDSSKLIELCLKEGANPNINDYFGFPLLLRMTQHEDLDNIKLYLENGGDVNALSEEKWNALHAGTISGSTEVPRYLVSVGIDYKAKTSQGETPRKIAKDSESEELYNFIREVEQNPSKYWKIAPLPVGSNHQFLNACKDGDLEKLKSLINNADQKSKEDGVVAAIASEKWEIVKYLWTQGKVKPEITDQFGRPVFLKLAEKGRIDLITLYASLGGNVNVLHPSIGGNALHFAALTDKVDTCKLLVVSLGIDFKLKNSNGKTAFDLAPKNTETFNFLQGLSNSSFSIQTSTTTTPTPVVISVSPNTNNNNNNNQSKKHKIKHQHQEASQIQPSPEQKITKNDNHNSNNNNTVLTRPKYEELISVISQKDQSLTNLLEEKKNSQEEISSLKKEKAKLQQQLASKSIEIEKLTKAWKIEYQELMQVSNQKSEELIKSSKEKDQLQKERNDLLKFIESEKANVAKQKNELSTKFNKERDQLQNEKNELNAKLKLVESDQAKILKEKNELSTKFNKERDQLQKEKNELNSKLKVIESEKATFAKEKTELSTKFNKERDQLQKENNELIAKLKVSEEENAKKAKLTTSVRDLSDFLDSLNLTQFFAKFQSESIEMETLELMKEEDFEKLGLNMGQRKKLIKAIQQRKPKPNNIENSNNNSNNNNNNQSSSSQNLSSSQTNSIDFIGHFGVSKSDVVEGKLLGSGASGDVFQGVWKGVDVAVKRLKLSKMSESNAKSFKDEANLMFRLRHPHIVQLMGFVDQEPYMLIMEFVEKGNLSDFLKNSIRLDWFLKRQFTLQIAQGMVYLHDKGVLHRDLKSLNVLLSQHLVVKLSDFGLASLKKELIEQSHSSASGATGTFAWMAPELFNGEKNSKESDVYSFGVVCFEIATHKLPWKSIPPAQVIQLVSQGKREEIPKDVPQEFSQLIESCWNQNPKNRKTFEELIRSIHRMNVGDNYNSNKGLEDMEN